MVEFFSLITKNFHVHLPDLDVRAFQPHRSESTVIFNTVNINAGEAGLYTVRLKCMPRCEIIILVTRTNKQAVYKQSVKICRIADPLYYIRIHFVRRNQNELSS